MRHARAYNEIRQIFPVLPKYHGHQYLSTGADGHAYRKPFLLVVSGTAPNESIACNIQKKHIIVRVNTPKIVIPAMQCVLCFNYSRICMKYVLFTVLFARNELSIIFNYVLSAGVCSIPESFTAPLNVNVNTCYLDLHPGAHCKKWFNVKSEP